MTVDDWICFWIIISFHSELESFHDISYQLALNQSRSFLLKYLATYVLAYFMSSLVRRESKKIKIWNNGKGIPVVEHKTEKMYVPTMIFGHLLTSSNYDDTEKKVTGKFWLSKSVFQLKVNSFQTSEFGKMEDLI